MQERLIVMIIAVIAVIVGERLGNPSTIFHFTNILICFFSFLLIPFFIAFYRSNEKKIYISIGIILTLLLYHNSRYSLYAGIALTVVYFILFLVSRRVIDNSEDRLYELTEISDNKSLLKIIIIFNKGILFKYSLVGLAFFGFFLWLIR